MSSKRKELLIGIIVMAWLMLFAIAGLISVCHADSVDTKFAYEVMTKWTTIGRINLDQSWSIVIFKNPDAKAPIQYVYLIHFVARNDVKGYFYEEAGIYYLWGFNEETGKFDRIVPKRVA